MPPAPKARDQVLTAFRTLLVEQGERAATLDATAAAAGVSKGGLLYHFGSKAELADGLIAQLRAEADADCDRIRTTPEGPIDYFLRSSAASGSDFDLLLTAVKRLEQSGSYASARPALDAVVEGWLDALSETIGDPVLGRLVEVLGDGLYFNSSLQDRSDVVVAARVSPDELEEMIAAMQSLAESRGARP